MADSVARLYNAVIEARSADPAKSRTARLLRAGRAKMAKKLGEEAVEVVIDAMHGQTEAVDPMHSVGGPDEGQVRERLGKVAGHPPIF